MYKITENPKKEAQPYKSLYSLIITTYLTKDKRIEYQRIFHFDGMDAGGIVLQIKYTLSVEIQDKQNT